MKLSESQIVLMVEATFGVLLAVGVGLIVGAMSPTAGVGAGLLAFSLIGFTFVIAWERGRAGKPDSQRGTRR